MSGLPAERLWDEPGRYPGRRWLGRRMKGWCNPVERDCSGPRGLSASIDPFQLHRHAQRLTIAFSGREAFVPRSVEIRSKSSLRRQGWRQAKSKRPVTGSRLGSAQISPSALPPARCSVICEHYSVRLPATTFIACAAKFEGMFGSMLASGNVQPMACSCPTLRVTPETPTYTLHEVQRPSGAHGIGQQQALSAYVQQTRADRLPCTCQCHA
jgi:hypothetical protein